MMIFLLSSKNAILKSIFPCKIFCHFFVKAIIRHLQKRLLLSATVNFPHNSFWQTLFSIYFLLLDISRHLEDLELDLCILDGHILLNTFDYFIYVICNTGGPRYLRFRVYAIEISAFHRNVSSDVPMFLVSL